MDKLDVRDTGHSAKWQRGDMRRMRLRCGRISRADDARKICRRRTKMETSRADVERIAHAVPVVSSQRAPVAFHYLHAHVRHLPLSRHLPLPEITVADICLRTGPEP